MALLDTENRTVGYLTPGADLGGLLPTDPGWVETMRRRLQGQVGPETPP